MSHVPYQNLYDRLPPPSKVVRLVESAEDVSDTAALDFYENRNKAWRVQYKNPTLASLGIGVEFAPLSVSKRMMRSQSSQSSQSTQLTSVHSGPDVSHAAIDADGNTDDDDTENNNDLTGNISRGSIHDLQFPSLLHFMPDYMESDNENTMQYPA